MFKFWNRPNLAIGTFRIRPHIGAYNQKRYYVVEEYARPGYWRYEGMFETLSGAESYVEKAQKRGKEEREHLNMKPLYFDPI